MVQISVNVNQELNQFLGIYKEQHFLGSKEKAIIQILELYKEQMR